MPEIPENFAEAADGGLRLTPCSPSSLTPETDSQTRHSWVWDTHAMDYRPSGIVVDADLARKMERERDSARTAAKYAECYMRHHHGCRTQAPLSEATAERCDCGLIETWREVRKGILSENV
jgi:hypothetical protein